MNILGKFSVLFLIENVPFSLDTRVQRQASVVQKMGGKSIVICPGDGRGWFLDFADVRVYQYPKPQLGTGVLSHFLEYVASLFFHTALTLWVAVRHGFDIIHGANPPDIFWMVAAPYKLFGKKYIFDQHDLVPELFQVCYSQSVPWLYPITLWMERRNVKLADHVLSTNETFRRLAIERGGKAADAVSVVRNGPWLTRDFLPGPIDARVRSLGQIVVGYLGIMNPQDDLENFLEAARIIRFDHQRRDIGFVMVGSGDAYGSLVRLRDRLGLKDVVYMPGTLPWGDVLAALRAADICVQPDRPSVMSRHLTMNKLMEYMAVGKPVVAYDLPETRISGGAAITYAEGASTEALAIAVLNLADDPEKRRALGEMARQRVEKSLCWELQMASLRDAYLTVLRRHSRETLAEEQH